MVLILHAALLLATAATPSAVVQAFYDKYLAKADTRVLARAYFTPSFGRDYGRILDADACITRGVGFIDYDPFFGSQVEDLKAVAGRAMIAGSAATVPVVTTLKLSKPFPSRMTVKLQRGGGAWRIADFIDAEGNSFQSALTEDIARLHDPNARYSKAERACIDKLR